MTIIDWAYPAGGLVFVFLGGITFWWFRGQNEQNSAELLGKIGELEEANNSLQSQLTNVKMSPVVAPQDDALHLKGKIYHLEQNLAELQKSLQGQEGEKELLRQRAHRDEQEILNLQQKINILDDSIKQNGIEHSDQLQALLVENDILSQCLKREVAKASDLQQQVCQIDRWRRESDESKQRIQSLGQEVIQLQETYNQAIAEKDQLAQELTQSQATLQQINATYNQAIAEKEQLAQDLTQSQATLQQLNGTYNQAIAEKDQLAQDLSQSQATLQQLNATYNQASAEKEQLAQELTQSQATLKQLETTHNQAIAEKEQLAQELTQSQATLKQLNATHNQAIAEKDQLAQDLSQSQEENRRLTINLQTIQGVKKEQEFAHQEIRVKWEATQAQLETVTDQKKAHAAELKTLHAQIKALEEQVLAVREPVDIVDSPPVPAEEPVDVVTPPPVPAEEPVDVVDSPPVSAEEPVDVVDSPPVSVEEPCDVVDSAPGPADKISTIHPFDGKKIAIIGTLSQMKREEAKTIIHAKGGSITSSPSSKTDFVIVGKAPGDKLKKAQKLGIPQLSESQFLTLLESGHE